MAGLALCGNQLIHDAALSADKIALRPLRDLREARVVYVDVRECRHGLAHGNFKRGRRRQSSAFRQVACNGDFSAAEGIACILQGIYHPAHIIGPGLLYIAF